MGAATAFVSISETLATRGHAAVGFSLELRRASADDGAAMVAIYNESIGRGEIARHGHSLTRSELAGTLMSAGDRDHACVALVDGVIRGWAGFCPWHQRSAYAATLELLVYVTRAHRGRGLGKALVERTVAAAANAGYHSIVALSPADDAAAARLSRSAGFVVSGILEAVCPRLDGLRDVVMYQRMLGDRR